MNDDDLQRRLSQWTVPEASDATRARARHRAKIAFDQRGTGRKRKTFPSPGIWSWKGAVVLALIVGTLPALLLRPHSSAENLAKDRAILQEVEELFPGQVDAVVEKNGKTDLSIADSPMVGSGQPVLVIFKRGRDTIRVLSYSGHRVCLSLGRTTHCFDILETPGGGVILEGQDQVYIASQHPVVEGYTLRAQTLRAAL